MIDNYIAAVKRALTETNATICVGDLSVDYFDLNHSRDVDAIVEACEATDSPIIQFYVSRKSQGQMSVLVGYGDESICDYHSNQYMNEITGDSQ
jgi:hypothetical protein